MIRVNLASKAPCPTCGGDTIEDFDGGSDTVYEYCERRRYALRGPLLRAWCEEHAKHCQGCDGRDGPAEWKCDFFAAPARWITDALRESPAPA